MNLCRLLGRLVAVLAIVGLALAPVARPAMAAGTMSDESMSAMTDDMDMSVSATADAMAGDMPCCPSKAPTPIDCDKCVFMAACAAKCFSGLAVAVFQPFFAVSAGFAHPQNDFWPDDLGHPPPDHPPRTSI